ncbi:hypothetical protein ACQVPJ_22115 [Bacillus mycoides]|nr:hypothetical protein [Bacillus mycoides]MCQ6568867.1 hypothetical protein [Bacillus mycoides]
MENDSHTVEVYSQDKKNSTNT